MAWEPGQQLQLAFSGEQQTLLVPHWL